MKYVKYVLIFLVIAVAASAASVFYRQQISVNDDQVFIERCLQETGTDITAIKLFLSQNYADITLINAEVFRN